METQDTPSMPKIPAIPKIPDPVTTQDYFLRAVAEILLVQVHLHAQTLKRFEMLNTQVDELRAHTRELAAIQREAHPPTGGDMAERKGKRHVVK